MHMRIVRTDCLILALGLALGLVLSCTPEETPTQTEPQLQLLGGSNYYTAGPEETLLEGITFSSTGPWRTSLTFEGEGGWIYLEPGYGAEAGEHTLSVTLLANRTGSARRAEISIRQTGSDPLKIFVTQESSPRIQTEYLSVTSPKLGTELANPLLDFHFVADPTALEYDGRLYVYGTNDHQQFQEASENTYEKIKSLVVFSTDDMVNWTYHGLIPVGEIAPWISASWAPSVVYTQKADGSPRFSLYFSNSGWGVGVLEAGSPLGPWTSPLDASLIDGNNETVKGSGSIFDPGALVDDVGTPWVAFGGTQGWLARLGADMHSFDTTPMQLPSPFHFEANELNCIGGTYVYTYNTNWQDHSSWTWGGTVPGACSMVYMKSTTPMDADSWTYGGMYFKNPGYNGFDFGNNHTHLHKYQDKWYLFYHVQSPLQSAFGTTGGFRSLQVDEIEVDEENVTIKECIPTREGVQALKNLDPFALQRAATVAATQNIVFNATGEAGHTTAAVGSPALSGSETRVGVIEVRGVDFGTGASQLTCRLRGEGLLSVRLDDFQGEDIALLSASKDAWSESSTACYTALSGVHTLYFIMEQGVELDSWQFAR